MELLKSIKERRTVRSFRSKKIPRKIIEKIIQAGINAPSPLNSQPWNFYVIEGDARNKFARILSKCTKYLEDVIVIYSNLIRETEDRRGIMKQYKEDMAEFFVGIGHAPTLILVTMPEEKEDKARKAALIANGCAIQNIHLAAWAENIGCVCLTASCWVEDLIKDSLSIQSEEVVTVIALGYPKGKLHDVKRNSDVYTWVT